MKIPILGSLLICGRTGGYKIGLLVKTYNNEFFELARDGCAERAALTNNSTCDYRGPLPTPEVPNPDPDGLVQADMLRQLLNESIDGLAVSVKNPEAITPVINEAMERGIPVVTFDSDADMSNRISYIGTDNLFMGETLAKVSKQIAAQGGTFAILMSDNAANMIERRIGFQQEMLADQQKDVEWTEISGSPFNYNRDLDAAIDQMERFAEQNVTVISSTTGGPMWSDRYESFATRHRHVTIVLADDFPRQLNLLSKGKTQGLVGQMPFEMGYRAADALLELLEGREVAKTIGTNLISHIQVPLVLPELVVDNNLIGGLRVIGYVLFALVTICALSCMGWTIYHRKVSVVKAAQPGFLLLIALGILTMGAALIPLTIDDGGKDDLTIRQGQLVCMSVPWLACCGFTITFSALFSKMRKFNRLLRAAVGFQRVKVTNKEILAPFAILLTLNVIVLSLWSVFDPLQFVRNPNPGTDGWNRIISTYGACRSENVEWYLAPLGIINLSVLCYANYQAYISRKIEAEFSESRFIAMSMVSLLQSIITGFPVVFVVRDSPPAYYLVTSFMLFVICMAILLLIFVPKILKAEDYSKRSATSQRRLMADAIRRSSVVSGSSSSVNVRRRGKLRDSSGEIKFHHSSGTTVLPDEDPTSSTNGSHNDVLAAAKHVRFEYDLEQQRLAAAKCDDPEVANLEQQLATVRENKQDDLCVDPEVADSEAERG